MSNTKIINMTPHKVVLYSFEGKEILREFPSNGTVRLETTKQEVLSHPLHGELPIYKVSRSNGKLYLPDLEEGVFYIVSSMVQEAYPTRLDFIAPNTSADSVGAVRNEKGEIIGVKSFIVNPQNNKQDGDRLFIG